MYTKSPATSLGMRIRRTAALLVLLLPACSSQSGIETPGESENEVIVDTRDPVAKAQYDADAAFARAYTPRCATTSGRPRVLVTGFGRFQSIGNNVTGRVVSHLVPDAAYPDTAPAEDGQVDPPGPQTSVALGKVNLPSQATSTSAP